MLFRRALLPLLPAAEKRRAGRRSAARRPPSRRRPPGGLQERCSTDPLQPRSAPPASSRHFAGPLPSWKSLANEDGVRPSSGARARPPLCQPAARRVQNPAVGMPHYAKTRCAAPGRRAGPGVPSPQQRRRARTAPVAAAGGVAGGPGLTRAPAPAAAAALRTSSRRPPSVSPANTSAGRSTRHCGPSSPPAAPSPVRSLAPQQLWTESESTVSSLTSAQPRIFQR